MIFIDSNVPMYIVGAAHPNKAAARRLLEEALRDGVRLVTSAEVLQEILHRYVAIGRLDAIGPALEVLLAIVDQVVPIEGDDVIAAHKALQAGLPLSAGDALHVAVMQRHDIERIMTFDRAFDDVPGIQRLGS